MKQSHIIIAVVLALKETLVALVKFVHLHLFIAEGFHDADAG